MAAEALWDNRDAIADGASSVVDEVSSWNWAEN